MAAKKKKVEKPAKSKTIRRAGKTVKKIVSKKTGKVKIPQTMKELLKQTGYVLKGLKKGQLVEGVVTDITKKMMLIDIGAKTEGVILGKEFEISKDMIGDLTVGDTLQANVVMPENDRGQILLSLRQAAMDKKWNFFDQLLKTGESIKVNGLEVNKGGIIVRIQGVRGFVPSSQFGRQYLGRMDELQNKEFSVKVIEVDRKKNRLIFSEKAVSEQDALAQQKKALGLVKKGDELGGVVSGIMPFGVFVRANVSAKSKKDELFLEGLVHISEISWEKVENPGSHYKAGDKIKVKVIGVDEKSARLNLSVKQLGDDPWEKITDKYSEGAKVKGEITKLD